MFKIDYFIHESGITTLTLEEHGIVLLQLCDEDAVDAQRIGDLLSLTEREEIYLDDGGRYGEYRRVKSE